jgi:hypothetical protein
MRADVLAMGYAALAASDQRSPLDRADQRRSFCIGGMSRCSGTVVRPAFTVFQDFFTTSR